MSQLNIEGKDLYVDYLKKNLTEEKIDKILKKYFNNHYTKDRIKPIVQFKKPFFKLEPLTNEEIHKSNEQFLRRKLSNLTQIYREVNSIKITTNEILKERRPKCLTFIYRHKRADTSLTNLADLFFRLQAKGFIEKNQPNGNNARKFKAIFRGTTEVIPFEDRIIWKGNYYALRYFVTLLRINKIIEISYHGKWKITANCFTKREINKTKEISKIIELKPKTLASASNRCKQKDIDALNEAVKWLMSDLNIDEEFKDFDDSPTQ